MARGDLAARDEFVRLVYRELHETAARIVRGQRPDNSLCATALVNEVYVKLFNGSASWNGRAHFLAAAAKAMRHVVVDHARKRRRIKREGRFEPVPLDDIVDHHEAKGVDLEALDAALVKLAEVDPEMERAIELRFFVGVSVGEIADILGRSRRTFERDLSWALRRLWKELRG